MANAEAVFPFDKIHGKFVSTSSGWQFTGSQWQQGLSEAKSSPRSIYLMFLSNCGQNTQNSDGTPSQCTYGLNQGYYCIVSYFKATPCAFLRKISHNEEAFPPRGKRHSTSAKSAKLRNNVVQYSLSKPIHGKKNLMDRPRSQRGLLPN